MKSPIHTILLSKSDFSFAFLLVTFELLELEQSYVPLLKALMCVINAVGAQGSGYMLHAPLKMAVLLHKQASDRFHSLLTVPLLKALMCGINAVGAQGSGCMFTLCHAPLKMAVLLHKTGNVCRVMITAVCSLAESH